VAGRREELLARHEKTVLAAWKALVSGLSARDLVRQFRAETAGTTGRDLLKDAGRSLALAWLEQAYGQDGWQAFTEAISSAILAAAADGEAGALAQAAAGKRKRLDWPAAVTAASTGLQDDPELSRRVQDAATAIMAGAASGIALKLADGSQDGAGEEDTSAAVTAAVTGDDAGPVASLLHDAMWSAIGYGLTALALRVMSGAPPAGQPGTGSPPEPPGPVMISWVNDGKPCPVCMDLAGKGPYAPQDVPASPHPNCRCETRITDPAAIPTAFFAAYLLS
jgi:hypothetical protein